MGFAGQLRKEIELDLADLMQYEPINEWIKCHATVIKNQNNLLDEANWYSELFKIALPYLDILIHSTPEFIDHARELQGQRQKYCIEKQRERDMDRAIASAAELYRAGHYRKVIEALVPFRNILPKSQLMKLSIAQKRVSVPPSAPSQGGGGK